MEITTEFNIGDEVKVKRGTITGIISEVIYRGGDKQILYRLSDTLDTGDIRPYSAVYYEDQLMLKHDSKDYKFSGLYCDELDTEERARLLLKAQKIRDIFEGSDFDDLVVDKDIFHNKVYSIYGNGLFNAAINFLESEFKSFSLTGKTVAECKSIIGKRLKQDFDHFVSRAIDYECLMSAVNKEEE